MSGPDRLKLELTRDSFGCEQPGSFEPPGSHSAAVRGRLDGARRAHPPAVRDDRARIGLRLDALPETQSQAAQASRGTCAARKVCSTCLRACACTLHGSACVGVRLCMRVCACFLFFDASLLLSVALCVRLRAFPNARVCAPYASLCLCLTDWLCVTRGGTSG